MSNNHVPWGLRHGAVVVALLFPGCLVTDPYACGDGHCELEGFPFCDVDGSLSGMDGPRCIAVECEPLAFEACRGDDEALICNATGDNYDVTHCEFGCNAEIGGCNACEPGSSECETHIIPRYLPSECDRLAANRDLTIAETTTIDTGDDATCNGGIVVQARGPEICILRYRAIAVHRNETLAVKGKRALALVADRKLIIDGILDVSSHSGFDAHGPGGGFEQVDLGGTGGVGFQTMGGAGGSTTADGGAANGGPAFMDPALLVELVAGPRGIHIEGDAYPPASVGGAATLISCRDEVSIPGLVDAGGGGGIGGSDFFTPHHPASGGGAGGNVVLQGMMVTVTGQVFANGGGGGAGQHGIALGASGEDGTRSDIVPAKGGAPSTDGEGAGGAGGIQNLLPGPGKKPATSGDVSPGAGGGSVGFFQTYTPSNVIPSLAPSAASPAFQANRTVEVRLPPR